MAPALLEFPGAQGGKERELCHPHPHSIPIPILLIPFPSPFHPHHYPILIPIHILFHPHPRSSPGALPGMRHSRLSLAGSWSRFPGIWGGLSSEPRPAALALAETGEGEKEAGREGRREGDAEERKVPSWL